jgi:hypothetical protein
MRLLRAGQLVARRLNCGVIRTGEPIVSFEIAFVVLLVAVVVGRVLSERALKTLSVEQKASLVDAFAGQRAYGLIPLVVLFAGYFALLTYTSVSPSLLLVGYWLALIAYLAWNFWSTRARLATLHLPQSYLTQFGIGRVVQYVGLGVMLAALIGENV